MKGFSDSIVMSINDCHSMSTDAIYFYFSKTIDSVNHDIILHKLKYIFKIDSRLLKFLKNYLCNRDQCVVIGGIKSSCKPVYSGIPQRSIIGHIIFIIFVNDLRQAIDKNSSISLYADDTKLWKLWRTIKSDYDNSHPQKDIKYFHTWSISNKINFNL